MVSGARKRKQPVKSVKKGSKKSPPTEKKKGKKPTSVEEIQALSLDLDIPNGVVAEDLPSEEEEVELPSLPPPPPSSKKKKGEPPKEPTKGKSGGKKSPPQMSYSEKLNKAILMTKKINTDPIPTRVYTLDAILRGGLIPGNYYSIASDPGLGKSTLALAISKGLCFQGKRVLYLDFEHGIDRSQLIGVGLAQFMSSSQCAHFGINNINYADMPEGPLFSIFTASTFLEAESYLDKFLEDVDLIIFDSTTAVLASGVYDNRSVEEITIGERARYMGNLLSKYKSRCRENGTVLILLQQMRIRLEKAGHRYFSEKAPAAGHAEQFFCDTIIMLERKSSLKVKVTTAYGNNDTVVGAVLRAYAKKSRQAHPFIHGLIYIIFGKGVSNIDSMLDALQFSGFVVQYGSYFKILKDGEEITVHGEDQLRLQIREHAEWVMRLYRSNQLQLIPEAIAPEMSEGMCNDG